MSIYNAASNITSSANGKQRKSTLIFPTLPVNPTTDIYIRTTSIERLDKLALRFYNDVSLWKAIAAANGLGKGTLVVPTDTRLRIPSVANINDIITQTNRTR